MSPVNFGIIGGGWRSLFFLRIAAELPERFRVGGMLVRDPDKGRALEQKWGVPAVTSWITRRPWLATATRPGGRLPTGGERMRLDGSR